MSRNRKPKVSSPVPIVGEGVRSAESTPIEAVPSGGGSTMSRPFETSRLIQHEKPGLITSPFGQSYPTRRSRVIADDEIQAFSQMWTFFIEGYLAVSGAATTKPDQLTGASTVLSDWYTYGRQQAKAALKYKHTPTTLNSNANTADYWNLYHDVVAGSVVLLNLDNLYQYNQAFSTLYTYLPSGGRMNRVRRVYRRAMALFAPPLLKSIALEDGQIAYVPGKFVPHIRMWNIHARTMYAGSAHYTDQIAEIPSGILTDSTKLDAYITNLEIGVQCLESANITFSANTQADVIAIKDLVDMMNDVSGGKLYSQGLPAENSMPGLTNDQSMLNDWYQRALVTYDTKGIGADSLGAFPVVGDATFSNRIPIKGWGTPGLREWTLFGARKALRLNDTDGLRYAPTTDELLFVGCSMPAAISSTPLTIYTREDGWVQVSDDATDFGDGAGIRAFFNTGHPILRHVYREHMFASQLTTDMEFRFLDESRSDYTIWMDEEDLGANHASVIAAMLGVPYIK